MDSVNTNIGQIAAREAATVVNEKSFTAANLVGFQSGASKFAAGTNPSVTQQVRFVDKTLTEFPAKQEREKLTKEKSDSAETSVREENVDISSQLDVINKYFGARGTEIAFTLDNVTAKQVITVTDKDTGDVIRQIPSEDKLRFAARMQEFAVNENSAVGIFIDGRA